MLNSIVENHNLPYAYTTMKYIFIYILHSSYAWVCVSGKNLKMIEKWLIAVGSSSAVSYCHSFCFFSAAAENAAQQTSGPHNANDLVFFYTEASEWGAIIGSLKKNIVYILDHVSKNCN